MDVSQKISKQTPVKGANSENVKKQGRTKKAKSGEQLAFAKRCQEIAQEFREEQAKSRSSRSQHNEDCAEFVENNQVIRMAVDQEDSFYEQEMASEGESEDFSEEGGYESTDSEISMDKQVASGCLAMDQGHSPRVTIETTTKQSMNRQQEMQYHQDKINAIDEEMKERVLQLHQMMAKGGLNQSAELLEKCFDTRMGKPKGRPKQVKNFNNNSNITRLLDASQSVETVY